MINEIRYQNMKGHSTVQALSGKDIFIGPNGSGKTTRIQALGLSILGYIPGNGKSTAETFKMATGDEMTVGLSLKEFDFERCFKKVEKRDAKTGKPSVTISESLTVSPGQGEKTDTQKKARIMAEVGNFPVALDFAELLSLSDNKRRDFIYSLSLISSDQWTKDTIQRYLSENLLSMELEINNPEQYKVFNEVIKDTMAKYPDSYDIHSGLQAMIDWTASQKSFWESKRKDAQGAVRSIADAKNQLAETDRNIAEAKKELDDLQDQLVGYEKQLSKDTERKRINENRQNRIKELRQQIGTFKSQEVNTDTTDIYAQIDKIKAMLKPAPVVGTNIVEINDKISEIREQIDAISRCYQVMNTEKKILESKVQSLKDATSKVGGIKGRCVIHSLITCPKDFEGFDKFVEETAAQYKEDILVKDKALEVLRTKDSELKQNIKELEFKKEELTNSLHRTMEYNRNIENEIIALEREKDNIETAIERRDNQLNLLEGELKRLMAEPVDAAAPVDILEKQIAGVRERISTLKLLVQEKEKAKQTILLLQQSMIDNKVAEYKAVGFKAVQEALGPKGVQGELVKEILGPIQGDIHSNLIAMGFDHEPYFDTESDTGKEVFQFGWINEKGHKVNFDALSTGQQTIYFAAMMMTILDRAKPRVKILAIDNLNQLDSINLQLAIDGLGQLAGRVDNIILAGAVECDFKADGWNVVSLGQKVVAKSA